MDKNKKRHKCSSAYILEVIWILMVGVFGRLIPHLPNMTPLTSLSIFAGVRLPRTIAFLVTLFTLTISDVALAFYFGYPIFSYFTLFTYSGFIGITLISYKTKIKITTWIFPIYILMASFGFWLWTNFGVWLTSNLYPKTFAGISVCYYMALPFLRNALIGDLIWALVIFGFARVAEFGRRAGFRFQ